MCLMKIFPRSKSAKNITRKCSPLTSMTHHFPGISSCSGWESAFACRRVTDSVPSLVPGKDRPRRVIGWENDWPLGRKALLKLCAFLHLVSRMETVQVVVRDKSGWFGFGYLFDLRSVFRNCLVRRIVVGDCFAYSSIWMCVKAASALCQEKMLNVINFIVLQSQQLPIFSKMLWSSFR